MKNTLYLATLIFTALLFVGYSGGPGTRTGMGFTASPGETGRTCGSTGCHTSGNFAPELNISVTDMNGGIVTEYTPGENYIVSTVVNATNGSPNAYGFQMVGLKADETDVAGWSTDLPIAIQSVEVGDRTYHEHLGPQTDNNFSIDWTAPAQGSGDITFYAAGIAANRDGGNSGDGASTTNFTLNEAGTSAIFEIKGKSVDYDFSPNPFQDEIVITLDQAVKLDYTVYDLMGKMIKSGQLLESQRIDLSGAQKGIYFLVIKKDSQIIKTERIIKQ